MVAGGGGRKGVWLQGGSRGDPVGMECSLPGPCQCPHPGCDADPQLCEMPPLGNLGKGSLGSLCILSYMEIYSYST